MKSINWKVRFKSKTFWVAILSAVILFINNVTQAIGVDYTGQLEQFSNGVNGLLAVLVAFGVIQDPTTKGIKDSGIVQTYTNPRDENINPVEYQKAVSDENNSEIVDGINGTEISQGDIQDEIELNNQTAEDTFDDIDNEIFGDSAEPQNIGNDTDEEYETKKVDADIRGTDILG